MSLADRIRKQKEEMEKGSTADSMKDSLASALKAKSESAEKKAVGMAERIKAKSASALKDIKEEGEELSAEAAAALQSTVDSAKSRYQDLVKRVQMTGIVQETTSLGNQIEKLPETIAGLRQRGYKFRSYLENKLEVMAEQWDEINERVEQWLENESQELDDELADAETYFTRLGSKLTNRTESLLAKFNGVLDILETKVEASEEKVKALYNEVSREVSTTSSQLSQVAKQLGWLEESGLSLNSGEGLYIAAEAEWDDGRDKPDGYLYVTDQRIIFEQAEKKGGMMGFGGKQVREVKWEAPLSSVENVSGEDKGMFGGKDMMNLKLGSGAPFAQITCEIKGGIDSKYWAQQVNRAAKGLIAQESNVTPDPELMERLKTAPTDCPNCSGVLPKLNAGQTEVTCKYCGSVMRI